VFVGKERRQRGKDNAGRGRTDNPVRGGKRKTTVYHHSKKREGGKGGWAEEKGSIHLYHGPEYKRGVRRYGKTGTELAKGKGANLHFKSEERKRPGGEKSSFRGKDADRREKLLTRPLNRSFPK